MKISLVCGAVAALGALRGVPAEKGAPETLGAPAREETSSLPTASPDNSVVSFVVDTWDERLNKAAAIERTIRRQHFLRGYEMGRGGERLGPEEAVAFLEEHAEAAEADIKEASREEIYEIRQMISQCTRPESFDADMKAIAQRMVQEALPHWQSAQADVLLTVMQKKPELWGIRFGGRRGVAFINQKSPPLLARLFGSTRKTARVGVRWEDGTSTDLHPDQTVEWCLMFFPASG